MSSLNEAQVRHLLAQIVDPHTGTDLVSSGAVRGVGIDGDRVSVELVLGYPAAGARAALAAAAKAALEADPAIAAASVDVASRVAAHQVQKELTPLPGVKNILAVASG